jgi:quinol monooxygenase YgiN
VTGSGYPDGDTHATGGTAMSELIGIARFDFRDGDVEEFKRLSAQAMEIVRAEDTGTLRYDVYLNADETEAMVVEIFRDSQALIEHGEHLAAISDAVIKTGSVHGELLGNPNDEMRSRLSPDGPVQLFEPFLSMERSSSRQSVDDER